MPVQEGIETLRALFEASTDRTVVMLSSLATRQTVAEALNIEAAGYLRKDLAKEEIGEALVRIFTEKTAGPDTPDDPSTST